MMPPCSNTYVLCLLIGLYGLVAPQQAIAETAKATQSSQELIITVDERPVLNIDQALPSIVSASSDFPTYTQRQSFSTEHYWQSTQPNKQGSWYKFTLQSDFVTLEPQKRTIRVESHILRHIHFYLFDGNTLIKKEELGINDENNLLRGSDLREYQAPYFQFYIQNNQPLTLYIYKQNDGPSIFPISIYSDSGLKEKERSMTFFWGGVIFTLIVMALYNIIVYSMHPNRAYLWYIGFHSIAIFYFGGLNGFGYLLFPFEFQHWLSQNIMVLNFLVIFLVINFASTFLELKRNATKLHKLVKVFSALSIVGAISSLWIAEYTMIPFFSILQFLGSIYGICIAIIVFRKGFDPAKYFLLSWIFTIAGGGIGMATVMGIIPSNFITLHSFLFGTLLELFLFSVALAHRMKDMELNILSQSYLYPDTSIANFSYVKNKLPDHLPKINKASQQLIFIVSSQKGFKELAGLYGPGALSQAYNQYTQEANQFLDEQEWSISMPLPTGEKVYLAGLPGEQVFLMADAGADLDPNNLEHTLEDICQSIIQRFQQPSTIGETKLEIEVNAGCAIFDSETSPEECFRQAQIALLYCNMSHQEWALYEPSQDQFYANRATLIADLKQAIDQESLQLYIQPQFKLNTETIVGGEILLRWHHDVYDWIPPGEFIPLAEQVGLIFPITKLVIKQACDWLRLLKINHPEVYKNFRLSVNISALDLAEPQLLPYLQNSVFEYGIENNKLMLEVTESASLSNAKQFLETIDKLHALGFPVSIDDFGTGYSSMQYLQTMKAEEIKIDMAFIRNIHTNPTNQKITKAIIQLAQATGAETVAEGIEYPEEVAILKQYGCDIAQGYYWSKPLALNEFETQFLKDPS